jgi:hypothetical protein
MLFHFTSEDSWRQIERDGSIRPGVDGLVHRTLDPRDVGSIPTANNAVRIEVRVTDAEPWTNPLHLPADHADAPLWRVVGRPIPSAEWVEVVSMADSESVWP